MTPFALTFVIAVGLLIMVVPRSYAAVPMLFGNCYITLGAVIMVGPADFNAMRLLVSFGWFRIFLRREIKNIRLNDIDKTMLLLGISIVVTGTILNPNMDAFINRCGVFYNMIGIYFFFRAIILNLDDFKKTVKMLCLILVPLAMLMIYEKITHRNLFAYFGGVPELSAIRNGRLRAQGPFLHPILAGTTGATCLPLILSLWWDDVRNKKYVIIGFLAAFVIIVTPASSGPIMALTFIVVGLASWPFRYQMKAIRRLILVLIVLLHVYMTAPVWFIIGRIGGLIGGTGWHRSELIDQAFRHLDEWWLVGTNYTRHWMPTGVSWNPNHADITNQYVKMGVVGGVITMVLFIVVIIKCFMGIGEGIKHYEKDTFGNYFTVWCLGATLFAHAASFVSVSYFDQIIVFYYLLLATISMVKNKCITNI